MNSSRLGAAIAIAPLVPTLIVVGLPAVLARGNPYGNALPLAVLFSVVFSYGGLIVIGLPLVQILKRFGCLNIGFLAVSSAFAGCAVFTAFEFLLGWLFRSHGSFTFGGAVSGAVLGLAIAVPFSLIAGIPARSHKHGSTT